MIRTSEKEAPSRSTKPRTPRVGLTGGLAAVLLLASFSLVSAEDASMPGEPGVLYQIDAGTTMEWALDPGEYHIRLRAGHEGATVDMREMSTAVDSQVRNVTADTGFTTLLEIDQAGRQTLKMLSGGASAIIVGTEFAREPLGERPLKSQRTSGSVGANACWAEWFQQISMREPYRIEAVGAGLEFVLFDHNLLPVEQATDAAILDLDPLLYQHKTVTIQACNPTDQVQSYELQMTYPAPGSGADEGDSDPASLVVRWAVIGLPIIVVGVAAMAWKRKRR